MGHVAALEERAQHALDDRTQRAVLLGKALGVRAEELLDVLVDEAEQRISVEEAICVGTLHGAFASFEERLKGSIEAGKLADLVVLGRDPLTEDPAWLVRIPVERTMVGGKWVFEA